VKFHYKFSEKSLKKAKIPLVFGGIRVAFSHPSGLTEIHSSGKMSIPM
jgi:hypothetical protein